MTKANAINKIRTEMDANKGDAYITVIGEMLIKHIESNPFDSGKIMDPNKTIAKSLDEMRKAAEEKRNGKNFAVLTDAEGFAIVLGYFQIEGSESKAAASIQQKPKANFDVKLDDYL